MSLFCLQFFDHVEDQVLAQAEAWKFVDFSGVVFDGLAIASLWLELGGERHLRTALVPHGIAGFFAARASEGRAGAGELREYPGKRGIALNVQRVEVIDRVPFEGLLILTQNMQIVLGRS
jgi:hypothetical protein